MSQATSEKSHPFYIDRGFVEHACCWDAAIVRKCKPGEGLYGKDVEVICECDDEHAQMICDSLNAAVNAASITDGRLAAFEQALRDCIAGQGDALSVDQARAELAIALAQRQQVLHKKWTKWAESKGLLPETVAYEAMRLAFEAGALTAAPSAQAEPQEPLS